MASKVRVEVDQAAERIVLRDIPLRMNTVVQGIMGSRHVRDTDDWTVPLSWTAVHQVSTDLGSMELSYEESARDWARDEFQRVSDLHGLQISQDQQGNNLLLPLQRVGAAYLLTGKRVILGDDMGAGKTVMTCDALASMEHRAILIACPKTLFDVWESHIHRWTTDITPIVASDSSDKRRKAIKLAVDLIAKGRRVALIMNYESVWRHTRLSPYGNLRMEKCARCFPHGADPVSESKCETHAKELNDVAWDVVVCDEAHRVINVSKQTRGVWYLSQHADYVWGLTGTPTRGSVADFWSLLRLVDPKAWPSKVKFVDRYCLASNDQFGNLIVHGVRQDRKGEFEQVTSQYMIRRMFEQIMKGWAEAKGEEYVRTEVIKEERRVELTKEQRRVYTELVDSIFVTLPDGKIVFSDNALEELIRLLQVSSATLDVDDDGKVQMVMPSPKIDELVRLSEDLGHQAFCVYAVNRGMIELARVALEKAGVSCVMVHGGIDSDERKESVQRFQDGEIRAFLGTFGAASEGLTLTRSHHTIYLQRSWSMILNKQADGRTHRYGQDSKMVVYIDVIAENTVESRVHEAYGDKLEALEAIVQDARRLKELL